MRSILLAVLALALPACAQESAAQKYFSDVTLTDQNGQSQRLYTDLLKDKTVVITSFFATCTNSCPVLHGTFAKLQESLGDRVGKDVFLLSITIDPTNDTPEQLRAYAGKMKAKPG